MTPSRLPLDSSNDGNQRESHDVDVTDSLASKTPPVSLNLQALWEAEAGVRQPGGSENRTDEIFRLLLNQASLRQLAKQDPQRLVRRLGVFITQIDGVLNRQLNAILHHPRFQRLEASWRGLKYLNEGMQREDRDDIKLKILNASWKELEDDFRKQSEFDQSHLFKEVYENEYGQAGGHPFGVLIGDFEIHPRTSRDHPNDDLSVLTSIGQVAAAAFCPFIAGASPRMFDFEDFSRLERTVDLDRYFRDSSFFRWQKIREEEDSRFIGLTLPRVLMRLPYRDDIARIDEFLFQEDVERGADVSNYLWGNASYAFAGVLLRSFSDTQWFIDTRGVEPGVNGGGLVPGLPLDSFATDREGIAMKPSTDVVVSEHLDRTLSELGFIPLCHCKDTEFSAFFSSHSIQKPATYSAPEATASARMSSMLQYMFCVSRFAHFLKVMARDLIGSMSTDELKKHLNNWLADYICGADSSTRVKTERPLESGRVSLVKEPGKAGTYQCNIELKPHFELEELVASVTLNTELSGAQQTS